MRELLTEYHAYQQWANRHILNAAEKVPFEQLTVSVLSGFEPVRFTLTHMMWAQELWLHRFQGLPRVPEIEPSELTDLETIRARWQAIDSETDAFLATLSDEQLGQEIVYARAHGGEFRNILWKAMLHQANHQTYHRGEVAAVLTHLGASPGELDILRMYDRRD